LERATRAETISNRRPIRSYKHKMHSEVLLFSLQKDTQPIAQKW
jgi:hypothetical protein